MIDSSQHPWLQSRLKHSFSSLRRPEVVKFETVVYACMHAPLGRVLQLHYCNHINSLNLCNSTDTSPIILNEPKGFMIHVQQPGSIRNTANDMSLPSPIQGKDEQMFILNDAVHARFALPHTQNHHSTLPAYNCVSERRRSQIQWRLAICKTLQVVNTQD